MSNSGTKRNWRHNFVLLTIGSILGLLIYKLIHMQIHEYSMLKKEGENRSERTVTNIAYRGTINDRNGNPLAISIPVDSIGIDPFFLSNNDPKLFQILNIINLTEAQKDAVIERINTRSGRHGFVYLKRQVVPSISQEIKSLNIQGITIEREFKRFYPDAEFMAHVTGFTNIDGEGKEGIELKYNDILSGTNAKKIVHKDLRGGIARKSDDEQHTVQHGKDIILTIDRYIQYISYKHIKEGVINNSAQSGSVLVINVATGEILAMANYPSYNPNSIQQTISFENLRNRTLTDLYEPGSVVKPFAAVAGIESGKYDVDTSIDTSPGYYKLNGYIVKDFRNYGNIDLRNILMKSSNVGISKLALSLEENILVETLSKFGFGRLTKIDFPGERTGYLPNSYKLDKLSLATLSFGYGMNVTTLQIAMAYNAIANHGKLISPKLLKEESNSPSAQIISEKVAEKIIDMLNSVVEEPGGTAQKARVDGYNIAGKTGTVRKTLITGGYAKDSYMAIFAGIAPAFNPKIVVVIIIDDPRGEKYGGGSVAAPIFSKITRHILKVMGIPSH